MTICLSPGSDHRQIIEYLWVLSFSHGAEEGVDLEKSKELLAPSRSKMGRSRLHILASCIYHDPSHSAQTNARWPRSMP